MQKPLSELASLQPDELNQLVERAPVLVTQDGEPHFVAQSLQAFEHMVRRLRALEDAVEAQQAGERERFRPLAKVIPLRP